MGQIYSFLGHGNRCTANENFRDDIARGKFSCKICLKVLDGPVQCQNNDHYFCRKCITMHLENSETCPACMDQLTLETLRPTSGIVANGLSELSESPCRHVSRGCVENVEIADVLLHEQTCGYAPVVCSNEGCKETVNRRSQERHETEECKFRKITCGEESNKQSCGQDTFPCTCYRVKSGVNSVVTNGAEIFIFGGGDEGAIHTSFEVCNWSTKTWTLVENSLIFHRFWSFSFIYGKK